jgi:sucrose phosphorylase
VIKINKLLEKLNPDFLKLSSFIESEIERLNKKIKPSESKMFSEKDTMLITYADQFSGKKENNIQALKRFVEEDLEGCTSIIHLLPFYPSTSDDGFSPIDYKLVDPDFGSWNDIEEIKQNKMFDCVFNHLSSKSPFFQSALNGDTKCEQMFHVVEEETYQQNDFQKNIRKVVRPRTSPLFSKYKFQGRNKYVWTTFSADQVDTNISNLDMLKYLLETFFLYIDKGAKYFRVDAVPFMWKELGTNCSHLEKTHSVVQLFRAITDQVNSNLCIITESNVPHAENISYWGNGENEAHVIYNFSLAPLILHATLSGTSKYINEWTQNVFEISSNTTFLNFTATHDGIGMRGLEGLMPEKEVTKLCNMATDKGGQVGKKTSRDGAVRPYELNITWSSILEDEGLEQDSYIRRVVNSQAIVMFFPGIGAHYVHNFLGTKNWKDGFEESGIARRLNRQKIELPLELDETSNKIRSELIRLIKFKSKEPLFSPEIKFKILKTKENLLSFERFTEKRNIKVHYNLSNAEVELNGKVLKPFELWFD